MAKDIRHIFFLLLATICLVACTDDQESKDDYKGEVRFSLSATRANTGDYVADAADCELIKWYRVVITSNNNRTILRCIDKTLSSAVELDPMDEIVLNEGTYNVYAFANIDFDYLTSLGIKEGGTVPADITTLRYKVPTYFNATPDANGKLQGALVSASDFAAAGGYIPMTSLAPQTVQVTSRVSQTFNIEVRRLFAKLEFVFSNTTGEHLQVNGISVGNMTVNKSSTEGSILLRNYEENRDMLTIEDITATLSHNFETPSVIKSNGTEVSHSFYVLESIANTITRSFDLAFNITHEGEAATGAPEDYMRYALTDPNTLTLIHRNDWIVIPITFSDWQMRLEARTYPPIGGYPEAEIEETESNEFVVKFDGGGEFSIRPFIRKFSDGDNWFGLDNTAKIQGTPVITVDDTDGIFLTEPTLNATSEIRGRMKVAPGKQAIITLTVKVITSTSPLVTKVLTRKIFVTQK